MSTNHEQIIRELYLAANNGPLRVALGVGEFPPYLRSGDVVCLTRDGVGESRAGEFVGVRGEGKDIRLMRLLDRTSDRVRVFSAARIESLERDRIVGRATHVERDGERVPLQAAESGVGLMVEEGMARARALSRRLRLQASLSSVYWGLVTNHEDGISETGDILTTNRCPVGCTFCIYSCVPTGLDMTPAMVDKVAGSFLAAGVPKIRILGGEPFMHVPHLVECFDAVLRHYRAEDVLILTSGYFGTSAERVSGKIDPLVARGLRHLHLSFDAFHLERYDVSCYERVLEYCKEQKLEAALVVHYSVGLNKDLETLLRLRREYPFAVRITTVSREGDAQLLSESETAVNGFDEFRERVLAEPGIELVSEERSCFRWTVFPSGNVHFCCKENAESRLGNVGEEDFTDLQVRLRRLAHRNRLNVLRFATSHKGELSGNACLSCPLDAREPSAKPV